MSNGDIKPQLGRQTSIATSNSGFESDPPALRAGKTSSSKSSQASSTSSSHRHSGSGRVAGMQSFYTTNLPNAACERLYISVPLDSHQPGCQRLAALQANTCVKDLGLVILLTRYEYPRTGRPSSYDQLEPVTRRWHILDVGPIITEVHPGIVSTKRKVLSLAVHDVTLTFKQAKQAFRLPDCFLNKFLAPLTIKAGKKKLLESRKSKAARQTLVNEDTAKWASRHAELHTML